jgi:uncharacterized lipoprotein YajG
MKGLKDMKFKAILLAIITTAILTGCNSNNTTLETSNTNQLLDLKIRVNLNILNNS